MWLGRDGLYIQFRTGTESRRPLGFVIKPASQMFYSERHGGYRRSMKVGPLYFRTYARKSA